jgi:hypothetical protein
MGLRFTFSQGIIKSDLKCDVGDLSVSGSKIIILIPIDVPSADEFSLKLGESIQGQLQYIIYFSEQPKDWDKSEMAPNQWPHESDVTLGWETISQGRISNPYLNFQSSIPIAFATIVVFSTGIYFILRKKKSSNERDLL